MKKGDLLKEEVRTSFRNTKKKDTTLKKFLISNILLILSQIAQAIKTSLSVIKEPSSFKPL